MTAELADRFAVMPIDRLVQQWVGLVADEFEGQGFSMGPLTRSLHVVNDRLLAAPTMIACVVEARRNGSTKSDLRVMIEAIEPGGEMLIPGAGENTRPIRDLLKRLRKKNPHLRWIKGERRGSDYRVWLPPNAEAEVSD